MLKPCKVPFIWLLVCLFVVRLNNCRKKPGHSLWFQADEKTDIYCFSLIPTTRKISFSCIQFDIVCMCAVIRTPSIHIEHIIEYQSLYYFDRSSKKLNFTLHKCVSLRANSKIRISFLASKNGSNIIAISKLKSDYCNKVSVCHYTYCWMRKITQHTHTKHRLLIRLIFVVIDSLLNVKSPFLVPFVQSIVVIASICLKNVANIILWSLMSAY